MAFLVVPWCALTATAVLLVLLVASTTGWVLVVISLYLDPTVTGGAVGIHHRVWVLVVLLASTAVAGSWWRPTLSGPFQP